MNYPATAHQIPAHLIFNKSAIARLLRIPPSHIESFDLVGDTIQITTRSQQATLTTKQLDDEFHRYRMEQGASLEAWHVKKTHWGELWSVQGSEIYQVEAVGDRYHCTCEDWHQHRTRCKHGWAVHFAIEALKKVSCHDCEHWHPRQCCSLRAEADLDQLPITHAEICKFLWIGGEF